VQLGDEALRAEFSAQRYASDGYPVNDASTQDQGSDTLNATAQLAGRLGGLSWSLRHLRSEAEVEYWSFGDLSQDGRTRTTAFTATGNPVPRWRSTLTLSRFDDRIDQNEPNFLSEFDFTDTRRDQLDWQNDIAMGEWLLWTLGATYEDEQTQARSFGTFFDERKRVRAGFLQGDLDLDAHRLIAAARYSDDQSFGAETTWNLDYGWQLADAWRLTAGAGTGFRAPDATDLFGSIGNPDLEPETSRSAEVGLRYRPAKGQELRLNAFDNRIRNLIEPNAGFTSLENIDRARIRGLEFGYDWRGRVWSLGLEGVAQDPRNETDDEPLPRRAERSASARLGYDQGPWSAGVQGLWVGERKDSSFSDIRLDAYSLLNLSLNYRLHAAWRLGLEVENLLDEDYETAATYPGRGRYVFVRLRHTTP
jgi:vitamin B12 transporter